MKLKFHEEDRDYFKNPNNPVEEYADLWSTLIPRSELLVTAKIKSIDPQHTDWWTPSKRGLSILRIICLDSNRQQSDQMASFDALYIKSENGNDIIKGIGSIGVRESDCKIHLKDIGLPENENGLVSVSYLKKLDEVDYKHYMSLMVNNAKGFDLHQTYEKRDKADRVTSKKELRPKLALPLVCAAIYTFLAFNSFYGLDLLRYGTIVLLIPVMYYIFKLIRYIRYKQ